MTNRGIYETLSVIVDYVNSRIANAGSEEEFDRVLGETLNNDVIKTALLKIGLASGGNNDGKGHIVEVVA